MKNAPSRQGECVSRKSELGCSGFLALAFFVSVDPVVDVVMDLVDPVAYSGPRSVRLMFCFCLMTVRGRACGIFGVTPGFPGSALYLVSDPLIG